DQIFNAPSVLALTPGRTVYHPTIAPGPTSFVNPLYTGAVLPWTIGESASTQAGAIGSSIPPPPAHVPTPATAPFPPAAPVPLTVPNLSSLYAHACFAAHLGLAAADYVHLVGLLGIATPDQLPGVLTRDQIATICVAAEKIAASRLSVADLRYLAGDPA